MIVELIYYLAGYLSLLRLEEIKKNNEPSKEEYSIIIPCRNEEHNISNILESIKDCNAEIIVVDDHSSDDSIEIIKRYRNVKLVKLEEGWNGKSYAIDKGVQVSSKPNLVFLDADVILEKNQFNVLTSVFEETKQPCSIKPYHKIKSFEESFSLLFTIISMISYGKFTLTSNKLPCTSFEPCSIFTKEDYLAKVTYESSKDTIIDDLVYGKKFIQYNLQPRVYGGKGIVSIHRYSKGIKDIIEGFSKNYAFVTTQISFEPFMYILLWCIGIYSSLLFFRVDLYLLYVLQFYYLGKKVMNIKWYMAFFYPLYSIFFLYVVLLSIYKRYVVKEEQSKEKISKVKN